MSLNYTAVQYKPISALTTLHNAARVRGGNYISISVDDFGSDIAGSAVVEYAIGVVVPSVIMIIFFIGWLISLCCAKVCCKGCCGKNVALLIFSAACIMSLIGWFMSLAGNVETTKGVKAMMDGIESVQNYSLSVKNLMLDAATFAQDLNVLTNAMQTDCNNDGGITFPQDSISGELDSVINAVNGSNGIAGTIDQINADIDDNKDMVLGYVAWRETGTMIVIVITIIVLTIFLVTTVLRVMDSTPEACRPCLRFSSRGSSCFVFIFGILLLLILWIFIALIHILATIGADLCAPDINATINRLVNEVANSNQSLGLQDPCVASPSYRDSEFGILCYYQTCSGPDKVAEIVEPLRESASVSADFLLDFKRDLNDSIQQFGTNVVDLNQCFSSMDNFIGGIGGINTLVNKALDLTTCPVINPIYASLLYSGVCNGLFGSLAFSYITAIIACVFMMLAMSIFRIFDFAKYEEGRLPEGEYEGEIVQAHQVDPHGGPIVQKEV